MGNQCFAKEQHIKARGEIMNKIIIIITIISFLNLIGCYYQEQMTPDNYYFDENEALKITTRDSVYNMKSNDYFFENDTLFGTIRTELDAQSTLKTNLKIPVDEIETVEVERTNTLFTILSGFGIIIGILLLWLLLAQPDTF